MLSVGRAPAQLRAVAAVLATLEPELRRQTNRHVRAALAPMWKAAVDRHVHTTLDRKVIAQGARIAAGNPPTAIAASSRRPLDGGLIPTDEWAAIEFGGLRNKVTTYSMRTPAGSRSVRRHASRQLPERNKGGRVAFPALKEVAPQMFSLLAATVVRTVLDEVERRSAS